ncbi:MAG: LamG domain-containing protein [Candidatus Aenigmarchaeota archaeon]|nr:LamG domain-containing protein [Candidatus Aenigmarchaeota archaeon]
MKTGIPKGATQVDYILAAGIFLIFFALTIQYITDYFAGVKDTADIITLRSHAINLLSAVDRNFDPPTWPQITNNSNDLVLLFHFNNDTLDYSGKGNNGTSVNGTNCSPGIEGRFFSGCSFDGINDFIDIGKAVYDPGPSAGLTLSAWVKAAGTSAQTILSNNDGSGAYYILNIRDGGTIRLGLYESDCGDYTFIQVNTTDTITAGAWHHIAGVMDRSTTNAYIYIDGALKKTLSIPELDSMSCSGNDLEIGREDAGTPAGSSYFNGTIDEVAIYNVSLSASDILNLYQQSLNRIGLRTDAYRFIVVVNNTSTYLRNTGANVSEIIGELVRINMSTFGFANIDYNSVVIYRNNTILPYQIDGSNITFNTTVSLNGSVQFTVYFDDDSVFPPQNSTIAGTDNLTEIIQPAEKIPVLQYSKLRHLNETNYTNIKNTAGIESSFSIKVYDIDDNTTFMDFGGSVPRRGDIVALQRFALFQNSTAGIRNGRLTVQTW